MAEQVKCPACGSLFHIEGWEETAECHGCGEIFDAQAAIVFRG